MFLSTHRTQMRRFRVLTGPSRCSLVCGSVESWWKGRGERERERERDRRKEEEGKERWKRKK